MRNRKNDMYVRALTIGLFVALPDLASAQGFHIINPKPVVPFEEMNESYDQLYDTARNTIWDGREEQPLQACEDLLSDPDVPLTLRQWTAMRKAELLMFTEREYESIKAIRAWLEEHPDDSKALDMRYAATKIVMYNRHADFQPNFGYYDGVFQDVLENHDPNDIRVAETYMNYGYRASDYYSRTHDLGIIERGLKYARFAEETARKMKGQRDLQGTPEATGWENIHERALETIKKQLSYLRQEQAQAKFARYDNQPALIVPLPDFESPGATVEMQELVKAATGLEYDGAEERAFQACEDLAAIDGLPLDFERYAALRPAALEALLEHEPDALEIVDDWLEEHPKDPAKPDILLLRARILGRHHHGGFAPAFDTCQEAYQAVFDSAPPYASAVIQAHLDMPGLLWREFERTGDLLQLTGSFEYYDRLLEIIQEYRDHPDAADSLGKYADRLETRVGNSREATQRAIDDEVARRARREERINRLGGVPWNPPSEREGSAKAGAE